MVLILLVVVLKGSDLLDHDLPDFLPQTALAIHVATELFYEIS
jgi:hypothetical protein